MSFWRLSYPMPLCDSEPHNKFAVWSVSQCNNQTNPETSYQRNLQTCFYHHWHWSKIRHCSRWFLGGHFEKTFFDIRVLNPLAPSNTTPTPSACYRRHEKEKQRAYEQRIREIERAFFTPIVLSTTGGMGPIATTFYKRLADRLASKWNSSYSQTIGWLRCRLSFSLLRSSILYMYIE